MAPRLSDLTDRVFNDEPVEGYDYEPDDLELVEPDTYATPDVGDEDSKVPPP